MAQKLSSQITKVFQVYVHSVYVCHNRLSVMTQYLLSVDVLERENDLDEVVNEVMTF